MSSSTPQAVEEKIKDCIKNKKRQLDLSFCNPPLDVIPDSLLLCVHLEQLYLVFNQIKGLPPKVSVLSNLKELYLHYNQLEELPHEIAALTKLEKLDLSNNHISSLPRELSLLKRLRELDLTDNPLDQPLKEISERGASAVLSFLNNGKIPEQITTDFHPSKSESFGEKNELENADFFMRCGIPKDRSIKYSRNFNENGIDDSVFPHLNHELLKEVGVDVLGDRLKILNLAKLKSESPIAYSKKEDHHTKENKGKHVPSASPPILQESRFPWQFPHRFLSRDGWQVKAGGMYRSFEVLTEHSTNDEEMADLVKTLFTDYMNGQNYELCKAYAVDNKGLKSIFEQTQTKMNRRLQFEPSLFGKQTWLEDTWRNWILAKLKEKVDQFPHNKESGVKSIPVLQGLRNPEVAWKIAQTGMASLSQLDDGYYGSGMYFTSNTEYAVDLYTSSNKDGYHILMMCWILIGNPFPCTEIPSREAPTSLLGKPLKSPHDCHFVVVEKNGMPCPIGKEPHFDEYVIKEEGQVLPVFVLYVKKR